MGQRPWLGLAIIWAPLAFFVLTRAAVHLPDRVPMKYDARGVPLYWASADESLAVMLAVLGVVMVLATVLYLVVLRSAPQKATSATTALTVSVAIVSIALSLVLVKQAS